jgi:hypothetical protein
LKSNLAAGLLEGSHVSASGVAQSEKVQAALARPLSHLNLYNICGCRSSIEEEGRAVEASMTEQDRQISEIVAEERSRLRNFIRRRVPDPSDVEDIVQEVFYELVEANRLLMPIDHVTGWLFRVARNRITDLFRKRRKGTFLYVRLS